MPIGESSPCDYTPVDWSGGSTLMLSTPIIGGFGELCYGHPQSHDQSLSPIRFTKPCFFAIIAVRRPFLQLFMKLVLDIIDHLCYNLNLLWICTLKTYL
jgi:hypothetical protein